MTTLTVRLSTMADTKARFVEAGKLALAGKAVSVGIAAADSPSAVSSPDT